MARKRLRIPRFGGELDRPLNLVPRVVVRRPQGVDLSRTFQFPSRSVMWLPIGTGKTSTSALFARQVMTQSAEREKQIDQKLQLLMEHFKIDPQAKKAYRQLAIELATICVRGFQNQTRPGAPKRWGEYELDALKKCVDDLIAEGHKIKPACQLVFANQGRNSKFPHCNSASTLCRRYHQAKARNREPTRRP